MLNYIHNILGQHKDTFEKKGSLKQLIIYIRFSKLSTPTFVGFSE